MSKDHWNVPTGGDRGRCWPCLSMRPCAAIYLPLPLPPPLPPPPPLPLPLLSPLPSALPFPLSSLTIYNEKMNIFTISHCFAYLYVFEYTLYSALCCLLSTVYLLLNDRIPLSFIEVWVLGCLGLKNRDEYFSKLLIYTESMSRSSMSSTFVHAVH